MWPKFLDMTRDECRGVLRRLELESYSNVVGTFRAQGTLSSVKTKILKDLREALHITEDRHKAEVRRAVNDEVLSTVAKTICGPTTEIEWHKEGARGFSILPRNPPQTALSCVADKASEHAEEVNTDLPNPSDTRRDKLLQQVSGHETDIATLVTSDPSQIRINIKHEEDQNEQVKKKRQFGKFPTQIDSDTSQNTNSRKIGSIQNPAKRSRQKKGEECNAPKPILNTHRRESIKPKPLSTNENEHVTSTSIEITQTQDTGISGTQAESETILPVIYSSVNADPATYSALGNNNVTSESITGIPATNSIGNKQTPILISNNSRTIQQTVNTNEAIFIPPQTHTTITPHNQPSSQTIKQITRTVKFMDPSSVVIRPNTQNNHKLSGVVNSNVVIKSPAVQSKLSIASPITNSQQMISESLAAMRKPPKINILSQQTITKSNINFLPITDNKIVIKSDSNLANAIKSQKIQILPSTNNIMKSNMIIRGTNSKSLVTSVPPTVSIATSGIHGRGLPAQTSTISTNTVIQVGDKVYRQATNAYQPTRNDVTTDRNVYVLNVQPPTNCESSVQHIENIYNPIIESDTDADIITEDASNDMIQVEGAEYYIDEMQNYEVADDNHVYTTVINDDLPTPAKIARISNSQNIVSNHQNSHMYSRSNDTSYNNAHHPSSTKVNRNINKNYVLSSAPSSASSKAQLVHKNIRTQPITVQTVVYKEQEAAPTADWEYELDQRKQSAISSSNDSLSRVNHIIRSSEEYSNSPNIIYTEVVDDNDITEEFITTEAFSPNENLIEMEVDSVNHDGNHHFVCTEEASTF